MPHCKTKQEICAEKKAAAAKARRGATTFHSKTQINVGFITKIFSNFKASFFFYLFAFGIVLTINYFKAQVAGGDSVGVMIALFGIFLSALAHGRGLYVISSFLGHISADVNPLGTIVGMIANFLPSTGDSGVGIMDGFIRLATSLAGSFAAAAVWLIWFTTEELGASAPAQSFGFTVLGGFWAEFFGVFGLVYFAALLHDGKLDHNDGSGWVLTSFMFVFGIISGGSFNWWRDLPVSAIGGSFSVDRFVIYYLGPFAGAVLAVLCWWLVHSSGIFESSEMKPMKKKCHTKGYPQENRFDVEMNAMQ